MSLIFMTTRTGQHCEQKGLITSEMAAYFYKVNTMANSAKRDFDGKVSSVLEHAWDCLSPEEQAAAVALGLASTEGDHRDLST